MAYKVFGASCLLLAGVVEAHMGHLGSHNVKAAKELIEIPASGGTRPVGSFGVATGDVSTVLIYIYQRALTGKSNVECKKS